MKKDHGRLTEIRHTIPVLESILNKGKGNKTG